MNGVCGREVLWRVRREVKRNEKSGRLGGGRGSVIKCFEFCGEEFQFELLVARV